MYALVEASLAKVKYRTFLRTTYSSGSISVVVSPWSRFKVPDQLDIQIYPTVANDSTYRKSNNTL